MARGIAGAALVIAVIASAGGMPGGGEATTGFGGHLEYATGANPT